VPFQAANRSRVANLRTSAASPMTMAATTGPTPNRPVTDVPDALTAVASFFLDSRIWSSRWRRSASSSADRSRRVAATGSPAGARSMIASALAVVISLARR